MSRIHSRLYPTSFAPKQLTDRSLKRGSMGLKCEAMLQVSANDRPEQVCVASLLGDTCPLHLSHVFQICNTLHLPILITCKQQLFESQRVSQILNGASKHQNSRASNTNPEIRQTRDPGSNEKSNKKQQPFSSITDEDSAIIENTELLKAYFEQSPSHYVDLKTPDIFLHQEGGNTSQTNTLLKEICDSKRDSEANSLFMGNSSILLLTAHKQNDSLMMAADYSTNSSQQVQPKESRMKLGHL